MINRDLAISGVLRLLFGSSWGFQAADRVTDNLEQIKWRLGYSGFGAVGFRRPLGDTVGMPGDSNVSEIVGLGFII
jgi:hypothetical protein